MTAISLTWPINNVQRMSHAGPTSAYALIAERPVVAT